MSRDRIIERNQILVLQCTVIWYFIKNLVAKNQSYLIKSAPWTILWFKILGIFSVENIKRLCVFMFQTCSNSQLLRRVLWISAEQTIGASFKHKNTQPLYIFTRENPQNSEPQNGLRSGLDYIALLRIEYHKRVGPPVPKWTTNLTEASILMGEWDTEDSKFGKEMNISLEKVTCFSNMKYFLNIAQALES